LCMLQTAGCLESRSLVKVIMLLSPRTVSWQRYFHYIIIMLDVTLCLRYTW
jgi:hypothetical protein